MKNQLKSYTNELLKNLKKRIVQSGFKDNIQGGDLADMQLISKFNKGFRFFLCVMIFLVNMLGKDKKGITRCYYKKGIIIL